jgi:hypothetical protein
MNRNANTPIHVEFAMPATQQAPVGISIFNLQKPGDEYLQQVHTSLRDSFAAFVTARSQYLTRLSTLGDNWISGSSKQPTTESIDLSKDLLARIGYWYSDKGYKNFVYPKIVMSPTPKGGIAMEIKVFPHMTAFVTFSKSKVEYEVEKNGHYVEFQANQENIANQLLGLYNSTDATVEAQPAY